MRRQVYLILGLALIVAVLLPVTGLNQTGQGVQPIPTTLQVSAVPSKAIYNIGERFDLQITLSADAFVYVFKVDANSNVVQQYPNRFSANDNFLGVGAHILPNNGAFDWVVDDPVGTTLLQVIASTQPIDFGTGDFDEAFPSMGTSSEFQQTAQNAISSILGNSLVSSTVTSYTVVQPISQTNLPPTAAFNYTPSIPFSGQPISFDSVGSTDPDGDIVRYEWDFNGDGVFDFVGPSIATVFLDGSFNISLRVTDNFGATSTRSKTIFVQSSTLNQPPIPSFTFSPFQPRVGDPVLFDASTSTDPDGNIAQWQWDFESNGSIDLSGERVITRFNSAGTFRVSLTVVDDSGLSSTTIQTVTVLSSGTGQAPQAAFTVSPPTPAVNDLVTLDASNSFAFNGATITQYQWDFQSDGVVDAFGQQTAVRFTSPGTARITLTVTDSNGLSASASQNVVVSGTVNQPPVALFTASSTSIDVGGIVTFDAGNSFDPDGFVVEYRWDFDGNGSFDLISGGPRVITRYNFAGTFRAILTVVDNQGLTATSEQLIQVGSTTQPPVASFTFNPTTVNTGQTVTFDATNSFDPDGVIVSYQWDFQSDGFNDATGSIVQFAFPSPGSFNVRLTVQDNDGLTSTVQQTVQVGQGLIPPTANFTFTPSTVIVNEAVLFNATSSTDPDGTIVQYQWDFDNDGITDSFNPQVQVTFSNIGTAIVRLTVTDNDGLTGTTQQSIQVQNAPQNPIASFTVNPSPAIVNQQVTFNASGSSDADGFITEYRWDFNSDGFIDATGQIVQRVFNSLGSTQVRLTVVDNSGLTGTTQQTVLIQTPNTQPVASFTISNTNPSVNQAVTFDASGSFDPDGTIVEYRWDFTTNGSVDALGQVVQNSFGTPGLKQITLTVVDNNGATASVSQNITVAASQPPVASFTVSNTMPAAGETITLDASASFDPDGTIVEYRWDYTSNGIINNTGQIVMPTFNNPGTRNITLTVVDNTGLTATAQQTITVTSGQPPVASFTVSNTMPVVGQTITLDASASFDPDGTIVEYRWDYTSNGIVNNTGQIVMPTFNNPGTRNITLTVVDNTGQTATAQQMITVVDGPTPPTASFTMSAFQISIGDSVTFDGSGSTDDGTIVDYRWDFNSDGNIDAVGISVMQQFNTAGIFDVTLTVEDNDGQTDSVTQSLEVIDPNAPPSPIPADEPGIYLLGTDNKFRLIVVGDPSWNQPRPFRIEVGTNTGLSNPVVTVFGNGSGEVDIPSNSDIVIRGQVGNGRVEYELNAGGSTALTFSSTFDVNGDGTRENRRVTVVQNDQLFNAGANFTLVAALDASVAIFPFGNKTLFACSGGFQNGQFQGCTELQ